MSHLQRVAAKINWLLGYRLHHTMPYDLTAKHLGFQVSTRSLELMEVRNTATRELRQQLKIDYERYAVAYRKQQAATLKDFDKHSKSQEK